MGKRGPTPKGKVRIEWSPDFAYAIGLIATDGSLSKSGRHIDLTSKDIEQLQNFSKCLGIRVNIGLKDKKKLSANFRVQIGDINFYRFLESIGLTQAKSLTIGKLKIPNDLFFDFLRGVFDGDGYSYSYFDLRWKSSFMFYIGFCSASSDFIAWLRERVFSALGIMGHVTKATKINTVYQLKYSKEDAVVLARMMYEKADAVSLTRKRLKILETLDMIGRPHNKILTE